jgi:hypothetical protein
MWGDPKQLLLYYMRVFRYIEGMRYQIDASRASEFLLLNLARGREMMRSSILPGTLREHYRGPRMSVSVPPECVEFLEEKKVEEREGQAFAIGYPLVLDLKRNLYMPLLAIPVEARDDDAGNIQVVRRPVEIRENGALLGRLMRNPPTLSGYAMTGREPEALEEFLRSLDEEAKIGFHRDDSIFSLPTLLDGLLRGNEELQHQRGQLLFYTFTDADYLFNLRLDYRHILGRPERLKGGTLEGVFSGDFGGGNGRAPGYGLLEPRELTESQNRAMQRIFESRITPIEGPPGTGKTTLIGAIAARTIVQRALHAAGLAERSSTLLITSTNNKAVSNVLEALGRARSSLSAHHLPGYFSGGRRDLVDEGVSELAETIQAAGKVENASETERRLRERLRTLKEQIDRTAADWVAQTEILAAAQEYLFWRLAADPGPSATLLPALTKYLDAARRMAPRRLGGLLQAAEAWDHFLTLCPVVLSTTLSVRNVFPETARVDTAIIDEASQTLFAYSLPVFYRSTRIAVVGDENQLQPIVAIPEEDLRDLGGEPRDFGRSTLGAVWRGEEDRRVPGQVLREHFRCRADIIGFSDRICGYGLVMKGSEESLARQLGLRGPLLDAPLVFIDVSGEHQAAGGSYRNEAEARVTVEVLRRIWWTLAPRLAAKDLRDMAGVLTPYRAQVSAIRGEILADRELKSFLRRRRDGRRLTVGTVHALQGDEKPVVLLSMVISKSGPGSLAFVNRGRNLLNVAVSRAQKTLVVVGDRARIEEEQGVWVRELWRHIRERERAGRAIVSKWTDLLSLSNW